MQTRFAVDCVDDRSPRREKALRRLQVRATCRISASSARLRLVRAELRVDRPLSPLIRGRLSRDGNLDRSTTFLPRRLGSASPLPLAWLARLIASTPLSWPELLLHRCLLLTPPSALRRLPARHVSQPRQTSAPRPRAPPAGRPTGVFLRQPRFAARSS